MRRGALARLRRDDGGAAAVEFALVLVLVLVPLTFGSIDMARAMQAKVRLHSAASNAAFYAITNPCDTAAIRGRAQSEWQGPEAMTVSVTQAGCGSTPTRVTVRTAAGVSLMASVIPGVPDPVVVTGLESVEPLGAQP